MTHGNLHTGYEAVFLNPSFFWDHQNPQKFWTWSHAIYTAPLPLWPFVLPVDCRVLTIPSYPYASLEALLESSQLLEGINNTLSNAWTVPGHRGRLPKARPTTGDPTGAKIESEEPLLHLVTSLVVHQVPVLEAICLLGVRKNAKIVLVHSLFTVSPDVYSSDVQLWGVVGDLLKDGTPSLLLLTGIQLSANFSFRGVSCSEF